MNWKKVLEKYFVLNSNKYFQIKDVQKQDLLKKAVSSAEDFLVVLSLFEPHNYERYIFYTDHILIILTRYIIIHESFYTFQIVSFPNTIIFNSKLINTFEEESGISIWEPNKKSFKLVDSNGSKIFIRNSTVITYINSKISCEYNFKFEVHHFPPPEKNVFERVVFNFENSIENSIEKESFEDSFEDSVEKESIEDSFDILIPFWVVDSLDIYNLEYKWVICHTKPTKKSIEKKLEYLYPPLERPFIEEFLPKKFPIESILPSILFVVFLCILCILFIVLLSLGILSIVRRTESSIAS